MRERGLAHPFAASSVAARRSRLRPATRSRHCCPTCTWKIFTVPPKLPSTYPIGHAVMIARARSRLVVRFGTRGFMYWTVVWSLCLLVLLGSFTSRGLGLGGAMLVVAV